MAKLAKAEVLMLNIGSMCTGARVVAVKSDLAKLQLTSPVCTSVNEKLALSRRVDKHWRLVCVARDAQAGQPLLTRACSRGWGSIISGTVM